MRRFFRQTRQLTTEMHDRHRKATGVVRAHNKAVNGITDWFNAQVSLARKGVQVCGFCRTKRHAREARPRAFADYQAWRTWAWSLAESAPRDHVPQSRSRSHGQRFGLRKVGLLEVEPRQVRDLDDRVDRAAAVFSSIRATFTVQAGMVVR